MKMSKQQIILLYGGRSAERKVSVLSAESVMRAINYDKFFVKTYFITQAGDFIKTQEFSSKPADNEKFHVDMHGCRFSAIRVENKMIHSLKVEKLKKEEDMNDESGNKVKEQYGNEQ